MTKLKKTSKIKPVCVGTGLVALDVILNGSPSTPAKLCVGGSCGNILSILSYLGWDAKPVARLSNSTATKNVIKDLKNFKVQIDFLTKTSDGSTPIIIHRILKDKNGNPKHRFEFRVPGTNTWLPNYKPVLSSAVESITNKQSAAKVFYFDRVSRSAIDLAKYYKKTGALIIFEPSSYKDEKQFAESMEVADIIKFSSDRIPNYSELFPSAIAALEIQTLGNEGLQYRFKSNNIKSWKKIAPFKLDNVIDAAGAGDWCTSGLINELAFNGIKSFEKADIAAIENALTIGQALGALNCTFDGARGIMYNMDYTSLNDVISKIISKKDITKISMKTTHKIVTIKNLEFETLLK